MGLTLEEINAKFGDKVELDLKDALYNEKDATADSSKRESTVGCRMKTSPFPMIPARDC